MKKVVNIITVITLLIIILNTLAVTTYATSADSTTIDSVIDGAGDFIKDGERQQARIKQEDLQELSSTIYNVLLVIGVIVAAIVGIVLAIKFITGSIEEKADVKAMLIPYVIGCVVVFGAFTIWKIVVDILQSV